MPKIEDEDTLGRLEDEDRLESQDRPEDEDRPEDQARVKDEARVEDETQAEATPEEDRRHERRYPVVGIELLYSPYDGKVLENTGKLLRDAVAFDMSLSGLSFDVREPVPIGRELIIQIEDPSGGAGERVLAEVRWCREIDDAHYRIGTRIKQAGADEPDHEAGEMISKSVGKKPLVPSGAEFRCPACGDLTELTLIGLQAGTWEKGVFPLYQCDACRSTRSIIAILGYNRYGF
ncbi:MAG: PilZ domain-containing protein [Acidobacteriota bacterium]